MSDTIREIVAKAIYDAGDPPILFPWETRDPAIKPQFYRRADAAIAAFEPMREALKKAVAEFDNFFAMVKGEIPSWMDDDHNYWKALDALERMRELMPDLVTK